VGERPPTSAVDRGEDGQGRVQVGRDVPGHVVRIAGCAQDSQGAAVHAAAVPQHEFPVGLDIPGVGSDIAASTAAAVLGYAVGRRSCGHNNVQIRRMYRGAPATQ